MAGKNLDEVSENLFCGNCGTGVVPGAIVCGQCGEKIEQAHDPLEFRDGYLPYCRACGVPVAREAALHCNQCGVAPLCSEHFFPSTSSCTLCPPVTAAEEQTGNGPSDRPDGPWAKPASTFPCHRCGARLRQGVGYCPNCGTEHEGAKANTKYVSFMTRAAAAVVDAVGPLMASGIIIALIDIPGIFPLIFFSYHTVFTYKLGQTPGKMMLGLQIVDANDNRPSLKQILLREVLGKLIVFLVMFIGFIWVLWDPKKRGWHDYIGGTYVIRRERQ